MKTQTTLSTRRLLSGALMTVLTLQPLAARAAEPAFRIVELGTLQIEIAIGALEAPASRLTAHGLTSVRGGRIRRAAVLHSFRAELLDAAGRPVEAGPAWEATLFSSARSDGERGGVFARLSSAAPQLDLPKPLGFGLPEGDSLLVAARIAETAEARESFTLLVTIEYQDAVGAASRLPVLPLAANGAVAADPATASWEWRPALSGRILALTGLPLERASELVLADAESGEVLWRAMLPGGEAGPGFGRRCEFVRLGVAVQEGRVYRLTAIYPAPANATIESPAPEVRAMLLPTRSALPLALAN